MSTFCLKILALILMTIDHIGEFIPNSPIILRWLGRLSAPIFVFCTINGAVCTQNKAKYLGRLYAASVIMSIIQLWLGIENNYFRVLFSIVVVIWITQHYQKRDGLFKKYFLIYLLWQVGTFFLFVLLFSFTQIDEDIIAYFFSAITGSIFNLEGGCIDILLGLLLYLFKDSPKKLTLSYLGFCFAYFILSTTPIITVGLTKLSIWGMDWLSSALFYILDTVIGLNPMWLNGSILFQNYQWMMVFALPFMLFYNHKRGPHIKWMFYVYYPLHLVLLYFIGGFIA